jgi:hypothetical protein
MTHDRAVVLGTCVVLFRKHHLTELLSVGPPAAK